MSEDEKKIPSSDGKKLEEENSFEIQSVSPNLPQDDHVFGPSLPPHLLEKKLVECRTEQKIYGPVLPNSLSQEEKEKMKSVPEGFDITKLETAKNKIIGPEIPKHLMIDVDDDVSNSSDTNVDFFGPSPSLMSSETPSSSYKFIGQKKTNEVPEANFRNKRESWMLELPEKKTGNLVNPSKRFCTRIITDKESDRSVWTETPEEKQKKKSQTKEKEYSDILKAKLIDERNKDMEKLAEKAARKLKKKESLLEMHVKKAKKKKKEAEKEKTQKKPERRPFDRNIDLQVRRFDETQKKMLMNKAICLSNRFASGESKFL